MSESMRAKAQRRLGDQALPGEEVLRAALAFRIGGSGRDISAGVSGVAGSSGGAIRAVLGPAPFGDDELPVPHRCIVALTTHRLLVFSLGGALGAGPKHLLHGMLFGELLSVSEPEVTGGVGRVARMAVKLTGGRYLTWEFPRLQIDEGLALVADLRKQVPQS